MLKKFKVLLLAVTASLILLIASWNSSFDFHQRFLYVHGSSPIQNSSSSSSNSSVLQDDMPVRIYFANGSLHDESNSTNPLNGNSSEKLFIIVAYRNRTEHKKIFLKEMTEYLQRKGLTFSIVFVEQHGNDLFNRAKLMNVGFVEAVREELRREDLLADAQDNLGTIISKAEELSTTNVSYCFIFHDIDMLPESDSIPYNCQSSPILLASSVEQFKYKLPYKTYFGGVTAVSLKHFLTINGFPNRYWGWGGEDDDFYRRFKIRKINPRYLDLKIGRYKSLSHKEHSKEDTFQERHKELKLVKQLIDKDGVRQLNYTVMNRTIFSDHEHVEVDLHYEKPKKS